MQAFIPGQRWISETESELGLGTVLGTDGRTVTVLFHAGGETRIYARNNAPLSRVRFASGDVVESHQGWSLKVSRVVEDSGGLLTYVGMRLDDDSEAQLPETELSNFIRFSKPQDRLFAGQVDPDQWFSLRYETLAHARGIAQSPVRGLCGPRVDLIPHQMYIAWEVANRYAPRVLLADEVGLGKTIEAGLIIHQQLLSGRASRVLLLVPETLMHQWLVEMLRRFNLRFSIFDASRLGERSADELLQVDNRDNLFYEEQLVLCSLDFLVNMPPWQQPVINGGWDLLVVDEAQHLAWSEKRVSPEYQLVEKLAAAIKGVLLLTATPEQLGKAGHFARLRLLDPERFFSYGQFLEEEELYEPVAGAVQYLLDDKKVPKKALGALSDALGEADSTRLLEVLNQPKSALPKAERDAARAQLLEDLLDRHGTGRVLFRNTRAAIGGFPERQVHFYPLPMPEQYLSCLQHVQDVAGAGRPFLLNPELCYQSILDQDLQQHSELSLSEEEDEHEAMRSVPTWWRFDPRVLWLLDQVQAVKPEKVLVICAHAKVAIDIEQALRGAGIPATVFHEGLNLVARDRAAAYFADSGGARVLACSEIGSEGRNFQFAHHLVLFDLPLNPDLLEQRIGRLDRIGQTQTIQIHVPYLEHSPQDVLRRWYQEGLHAFEYTCPAGHGVYVEVRPQLLEVLHKTVHREAGALLDNLLELSHDLYTEINEQLQRGRDRLLEMHSCRTRPAEELCDRIRLQDQDTTLANYLERVFEVYGLQDEEHSEHCKLIQIGENMLVPSFPELSDSGAVITWNRTTALSREEVLFLTWEHPMVLGAMDLVLSSGLGNTALNAFKHPQVKPGTLLLEAIFVLECVAPRQLQASRFLPPTPIRALRDKGGRDLSQALPYAQINSTLIFVDRQTARQAIRSQANALRDLLEDCEADAREQAPLLVEKAVARMHTVMDAEIARLRALKTVNPNVREEEVQTWENHRSQLDGYLRAVQPRLDALRVLVGT